MNKRGFLRIVEAGIAVLIILTAILINFNRLNTLKEPDYSENARDILREIAENKQLRSQIILAQNYTPTTYDFVNASLPDSVSFEIRACDVGNACGQSNYIGNVFSAERIISADLNNYDPIKLRLFIWIEGR